jgi:two-component sensor histidine kinase
VVTLRKIAGKLNGAAIKERDITDQKRAREQQEALVAELNHRVKNSLATVLSISSRALKVSGSLEEFGKALEGRLRALASAHELLARNVWSGADFKQVLLSELAPYYSGKGTDSVETSGRDLFVNSRAALVLGMVFHELATNAAKYGAFSQPAGKVKVSWKRTAGDDGEVLLVDWREVAKGVSPPGKSGFGMGFIERSLAYELHGTTEFRFGRNGLTVTIRIPLAELQERKPEARDE